MIVVEIFSLPNVPLISLVSGSGCSFNPNVLQVMNPEAGVTYEWSDGQTGLSINAVQAGAYLVTAINPNGCSATSNTIFINPSAPVDQIPGGCFIECDPLNVCLPPLTNVSSYTIYQDGNVFLSGGKAKISTKIKALSEIQPLTRSVVVTVYSFKPGFGRFAPSLVN